MTTEWAVLPFEEVFEDVSAGQPKTLARDFLSEGRFPLVDQGQDLIGGYTDDEARLASVPLPVIVFGDHTRAVKYVDFPFGVGADGVKLLRPRGHGHVPYFFRFLQAARVPAAGYDRHFKYLKRMHVPVPPIEEQKRIAAVLNKADEVRAKRQTSLNMIDSLNESIFLDMFGSAFAEHSGVELGELGRVVTGKTPPTSSPGMFDGPIPFVTPGDLDRQVDVPVTRSLTESGAAASRVVRRGSALCCCIGATIGKTGIAHQDVAFNQQINAVEWGPQIADWYGYFAVRSLRPTVRALGASTTLPLLNKTAFARLRIPVPSIDRQRKFGRIVEGIASMSIPSRRSLTTCDELFSSLQHRAFAGKL